LACTLCYVCVCQAIYDRQWTHWRNPEELKLRNKLATIIANDSLPLQRLPSFNEVIAKCQAFLEKIILTLTKPFLLEVAEQVSLKMEGKNASTSALQQPPAYSVVEKSPAKHSTKTCVVRVDKLSENGEQRASVESPAKQTANDTESAEISDDDSFDGYDDDYWRPSAKHSKTATVRKVWSADEEELVYKGAQMHGVGNWALIRANFVRHRSNVAIKDKWRTMVGQGRLTVLARKFGPLPFR